MGGVPGKHRSMSGLQTNPLWAHCVSDDGTNIAKPRSNTTDRTRMCGFRSTAGNDYRRISNGRSSSLRRTRRYSFTESLPLWTSRSVEILVSPRRMWLGRKSPSEPTETAGRDVWCVRWLLPRLQVTSFSFPKVLRVPVSGRGFAHLEKRSGVEI